MATAYDPQEPERQPCFSENRILPAIPVVCGCGDVPEFERVVLSCAGHVGTMHLLILDSCYARRYPMHSIELPMAH